MIRKIDGYLKYGLLMTTLPVMLAFAVPSDVIPQGIAAVTAAEMAENVSGNGVSEPTTKDVYNIGSISKMYTAAAIMKLYEEGKLDLDAPVTEYLPEFTMQDSRYKEITVRMLLNHTSGIMGMTEHDSMTIGACDTRYHDNLLEELSTQVLKAEPGSYGVYCNDGFTVAELIIERVSGMGYSEYLAANFWDPLGMEDTFTPVYRFDESRIADTYVGFNRLPYIECHTLGSGGIYSTASDVARFGQIFTENGSGILSDESLAEMAYSYTSEDSIGYVEGDKQTDYGLGWDCVATYPYSAYGIPALTKGGSVIFQNATLVVLPEQNISAAMIVSGGSGTEATYALQGMILEILEEEGLLEQQDLSVEPNLDPQLEPLPEEMKEYAGYYISNQLMEVSFTEEGHLLLSCAESEYDMVQEYGYVGDGIFVPLDGAYLDYSGQLTYSNSGSVGNGTIYFRTDTNGKTYLFGSTHESIYGLGENVASLALAEKVEAETMDDATWETYQERDGKNYFLVDSVYNSLSYYTDAICELHVYDAPQGYISTDARTDCARITDDNYAINEIDLPVVLGRDLKTYEFTLMDNGEQMQIATLTYISEEAIEPIENLQGSLTMTQSEDARWYQISEGYEGRMIQIEVPENGAYYIYNQDRECIATSVVLEDNATILLPTGGYLLLAGDEGSEFSITIE